MKLKIKKRATAKKSDCTKARLEDGIPAILYSKGKENDAIVVSRAEFEALLRSLKAGRLATTVVTLVGEDGSERQALVKDIQYQVTSYRIQHLDLQEVTEESIVNVNVPIDLVGVADCEGVKLGGFLRPVIRKMPVRCELKKLPSHFTIDVRKVGVKQSRRLSDIKDFPQDVRPMADMNQVAVIVAKR